jgi:cyanophycinase-like exopeptidase
MLAAAGLVVLVSGASVEATSVEGASVMVDSVVVELSSDPHEARNTSKTGIKSDFFEMNLFDIDNDTS